MAATKKPAKRSASRKRPQPKRKGSKKKSARKSSSKTSSKKTSAARAPGLQRRAGKGFKPVRGGLDSVLQAGEKTWETLKTTTAQMVEGVRETFTGEPRPASRRPRSR